MIPPVEWPTTRCASKAPAVLPKSAQVYQGSAFTVKNGDKILIGSHVIFCKDGKVSLLLLFSLDYCEVLNSYSHP